MRFKRLLFIPVVLLASLTSCGGKKPSGTDGSGTSPIVSPTTPSGGTLCYENKGTQMNTIKTAAVGETVEATVAVAGIRGSDLYVEDSTGAAFVYVGKNTLPSGIVVGSVINLSGTISSYGEMNQITYQNATLVGSSTCALKEPAVTTIANLDNYRSGRVSVSNLTVTAKNIVEGTGKDTSITVSDGTNETKIFIKKTMPTKSQFDTLFATFVENQTKVNVVGGYADYYKGAQIALIELNQISVIS